MKKMWNSFKIAFSMYSKIPMPQSEWTDENMSLAMCFFPWVGAVIGLASWVVYQAGGWLPSLLLAEFIWMVFWIHRML